MNLLLTSPESSGVSTYFQLGGYYSYHFAGKLDKLKIDFQDEFLNYEYGITYGFGIQVSNIQWGLYIQNGLSDLNRADDVSKMSYENVYFMLGFTF